MRSDTGTSGSMRAAVTKCLWRISEAWRGNPTSCLRRGTMRVMGVRVQGETAGSHSGEDNSREHLRQCWQCKPLAQHNFLCPIEVLVISFLMVWSSLSLMHTNTVELRLLSNNAARKRIRQVGKIAKRARAKPRSVDFVSVEGKIHF